MERTPLPSRVDIDAMRRRIQQRRAAGYSTTIVDNDELDSLLIEAALYRTKFDAVSRRQKDGARARKAVVPKITLQNVDQLDSP
jgi:hypothetical protein